jgi:hypothetical protein
MQLKIIASLLIKLEYFVSSTNFLEVADLVWCPCPCSLSLGAGKSSISPFSENVLQAIIQFDLTLSSLILGMPDLAKSVSLPACSSLPIRMQVLIAAFCLRWSRALIMRRAQAGFSPGGRARRPRYLDRLEGFVPVIMFPGNFQLGNYRT